MYTDENPKGERCGNLKNPLVKFVGLQGSRTSMEQRVRDASEAAVYRKFIKMKKKTKKMNEDIKKMDMGDVIKDFYKSEHLNSRVSLRRSREMAIAAKLQSQEEELSFTAEDLKKVVW